VAEREVCSHTSASAGTVPSGRAPERTCVGCRARTSVAGLLRVVVRGTTVVPDPRRRLHGRGAYVHPTQECVGLAEKRRALQRALKVSGQFDVGAVTEYVLVTVAAGPTVLKTGNSTRRQADNP